MPPANTATQQLHRWLYFLIAIAALVNFSGLFVPLMDPDAGVYASVTRNMLIRHDWLNLYFQDQDWLDKPHLPFWITAIFFKVFGIHDWSYKLPGICCVMLAARYTYLFTKKYYTQTTALLAAFILLSAAHILISNNDVRAEPFLTGFVMAAIYHFTNALDENRIRQLLYASIFTACALMTKGLFTLIPIGGSIGGGLILTKRWKDIFHWRWLLALLLIVALITPELYSLWYQFDQHPEKIVYGKTGVSGIRFFLWDSQFGRFANTGPIKGKGDPFFFFHTILWAFLPWAILLFASIVWKVRAGIKNIKANEWYSISGSLLTLLIFSVSRFQLPYYTNIIFPLFAILTAGWIVWLIENGIKVWNAIQWIIAIIIVSLVCLLYAYYGLRVHVFLLAALLVVYCFFIWITLRFSGRARPYIASGLAMLWAVLFLNLAFYPALLKYQSGNQLAFYVNKYYPSASIGRFGFYMPSGEFYLQKHMIKTDTADIQSGTRAPDLLFLSEDELSSLRSAHIRHEVIKVFEEFHVTMLTLKFLDPARRNDQLKPLYLVRLLR